MKAWIGCSGWQYKEWIGIFYPEKLARKNWFEYYINQFNTVEINSSFYHFPEIKTVKKWYQQAPDHFRYSLKVNRMITHYKRFHDTHALTKKFYDTAELLEDKLGCILFQLPPSITYNYEMMETIANQLDTKKRNVIEFRHPSWWNQEVYDFFTQQKISLCSVSAPKLPDQLINANKLVYIRFHGLKKWFSGEYNATYLKKIANTAYLEKPSEIWAYFNNDIGGHAPLDAIKLQTYFNC